jgi:hypothetical protein
MTGKIMWMKITVSLQDNVDLLPYERLFDAIDIKDDGTKPHLIEKYATKRFYQILKQNDEMAECHKSPTLFGNEVHLHSGTEANSPLLPSAVCNPPSINRWTLDEFFQNIDEILAKFGQQKTCESLPCNPLQKLSTKKCPVLPQWHCYNPPAQ